MTVDLADDTMPFELVTDIPSLGEVITATATHATSESTSEFSNCVTVEAGGGGTGGTLSGALATPTGNANLTTFGTQDWAVWGYAGGGTSTSLAPDVRKSGGAAISNLTNIDAAPVGAPLRGLGQFGAPPDSALPFTFDWSNGSDLQAPPAPTSDSSTTQ